LRIKAGAKTAPAHKKKTGMKTFKQKQPRA
jgi:hypothetical protein